MQADRTNFQLNSDQTDQTTFAAKLAAYMNEADEQKIDTDETKVLSRSRLISNITEQTAGSTDLSEDHCNSPCIDFGTLPRKTLKNALRSQDNLLGQYSPLRADFADKVRKLCTQDDERMTSNCR